MEHGVVMRAVGDTMIIAPPLIINAQQIDELMDKIKNTLDATLKTIQSL
jgi:putrescine aminotransferase